MQKRKAPETITVERPTGPRITVTPSRSLGELALLKVSALQHKTKRAAFSVLRYKAVLASLALAVGAHLAVSQTSTLVKYVAMPFTFIAQGPMQIPSTPAYQGIGDVVSGWYVWGSCARAYNAAYAAAQGNMCDLVNSSDGTVAICTLKAATTGFVNLTDSYCTGSQTPAAACAAAAGGSCRISKVYDQTDNGRHLTQATAAQQPDLTFGDLNSLPSIDCTGREGGTCTITTAAQTVSQPVNFAVVARNPSGLTSGGVLGSQNGSEPRIVLHSPTNNTFDVGGNLAVQVCSGTQAANAYHALQGLASGAASLCHADGTDGSTSNIGTTGFVANGFRLHRAGGAQDGMKIMEGGMYTAGALDGTQRGNLNTNIHSATNGYNF